MNKFKPVGAVLFPLMLLSASVGAQEPESFIFLPGEELDTYWVIEKKIAPHYPKRALQKEEQGCATVTFIVEPDGTTSNHNVLVSSSGLFKASSISAAEDFLYKPSNENEDKIPVITANTFTYQISNSPNADEEVRQALHDLCDSRAMEALGVAAVNAEAE